MEVKVYYNIPEMLAQERRKRTFMTIAGSLKTYLKYLLDELNIENYAMSYLIEDIVFFVVHDQERLKQFIEETYELEEGEDLKILSPPQEFVDYINSLQEQLEEEFDKGKKEDDQDGKIKNK